MEDLAISLTPDVMFHLGPVAVTNSMLSAVLMTFGFALFSVLVTRKFKVVPTKIQLTLELVAEYMLTQLEGAFGSRSRARQFFPMLMTLLLFIAVANQLTVIPLVGQIVYGEKPVFRLATADLSGTFALALVVVGLAHVLAFKAAPIKHISSFIRVKPLFSARSVPEFFNALLELFLGVLDIIGEFAKVLSLSFRLFGNIFAGEVMVVVIASLSVFTHYLVPIPFLLLSLFSGFVQAFVFFMLSVQFIAATIGSESVKDEEKEQYGAKDLNFATIAEESRRS